ncbi:hypothetical protein QTP88_003712 [Uroleucon formosanum]
MTQSVVVVDDGRLIKRTVEFIKSSDPIRGTQPYSALAASPPKRFLAGEDVLHPPLPIPSPPTNADLHVPARRRFPNRINMTHCGYEVRPELDTLGL